METSRKGERISKDPEVGDKMAFPRIWNVTVAGAQRMEGTEF